MPLLVKEDVMLATQPDVQSAANNERQYRSPNRVLARYFRLARDKWKQKYMNVRADLKKARKLAAERGAARDRWRAECDTAKARAAEADALAQQRLRELDQLRADQQKKKK